MSVIVVPSLYDDTEFYVFRPLGNNAFKEVVFHIIRGEIKQDKFNKLHHIEIDYINDKIL